MSVPTRGEVYSKLLYHIRMAQEHCATMGHLHNTEDTHKDKALAKGWLTMSDMFDRIALKVTEMAQGKLQ